MNSELFMFLLGVFITVLVGSLTGLGFRKWYRSPLAKRLDDAETMLIRLDVRTQSTCTTMNGLINDSITDRNKLNNTDSGLQSLYEIFRGVDKDIQKVKKSIDYLKDKTKKLDDRDDFMMKCLDSLISLHREKEEAEPREVIKGAESFVGPPFMNCSKVQPSEAEIKGGYASQNDPEYHCYHANNTVKPGSTYKQIEFDNSTDMFTITLNDGRKIASDITHIKDLLLKEAKKLQ